MTPAHWLLVVAINFVFGLNLVLSKLALHDVGPLTFTAVRFALVALVMAPYLRVARSQLPKIVVIAVLLGAVHFGLSYIGLSEGR